jgi:dihydroneopterin aldolase
MPHSTLGIERLRLHVRLGAVPEERAHPQEVDASAWIRFAEPPDAVRTDMLAETVDYAELAASFRRAVDGTEFNLIEHLAYRLYRCARAFVSPADLVAVRVHKLRPPLADLEGGSTFWYGDWSG